MKICDLNYWKIAILYQIDKNINFSMCVIVFIRCKICSNEIYRQLRFELMKVRTYKNIIFIINVLIID